MELTKEEVQAIQAKCLAALYAKGYVPDGSVLQIQSGSLGIRTLGKVDFLAKTGYSVIWTQGRKRK